MAGSTALALYAQSWLTRKAIAARRQGLVLTYAIIFYCRHYRFMRTYTELEHERMNAVERIAEYLDLPRESRRWTARE